MITQERLDELASMASSVPCKVCGKPHKVVLKLAQASANGMEAVSYAFPDADTCGDFQVRMTAFISERIDAWRMPPYPFDRI